MIAPLERPERSISSPAGIDAIFTEIDAEASSRALAAASAIAKALREPPVEPQLSLKAGTVPTPAFPPFPHEFTALVADPSARPSLSPAAAEPKARRNYSALLRRGGKIVGTIAAGWLAVVLLLIVAYRFIDPPVSALMLQQLAVGQEIEHQWVPINEISPNVIRAVLVSEDGRFCEHNGIDYEAIQAAIERAGRGSMRGASTISMQVVKNLFLWPSKSYLRKAIEMPLTYAMELIWSKRRIMEVYLNIAEWGPGIFGIESAARYHFNKSARKLTEREAARLAVALPNPLIRDAGEPGPGMQRLANSVQVRMRLAPSGQLACVLGKRPI